MKSRTLFITTAFSFFICINTVKSQEISNFPFDPFAILKSWNYDQLIKTMGNGDEVVGTRRNQTYLAGLRYQSELLGMHGKLEFGFSKDSISRIQFRKDHIAKIIDTILADRMARDTTVRKDYNSGIRMVDSLRRDSVVKAITKILGTPLSSGPTAVTEKNARYSAIWINRGYSCLYKDYYDHSEIVFALSTVPLWTIGEFNIPPITEIVQKYNANTRKMNWSTSLLACPSNARLYEFSDVFLVAEFTSGQRYLASIPKNPACYLSSLLSLEFATGQRLLLNVPRNSISYLPWLSSEDCDGDGIPEAWIHTPGDPGRNQSRHYLYSLQYREPNLIFNSDDQVPSGIIIGNDSQLSVILQDGTVRNIDTPNPLTKQNQTIHLSPKGFNYLNTTKLNNDGSTNFIGGIELRESENSPVLGVLEITYKYLTGGWETDQIRLLPNN